jgi:hypothetical protein
VNDFSRNKKGGNGGDRAVLFTRCFSLTS